ncbi:efflux RND transporter periplasmic adaptor subunit [Bermanella marisrubri]|uniref:AcrA/AcrE family protein n=1 Tax=Bermanella marisrubri TaxID=207949 RepID=Q1N1T6_9GAMM|nr:efflux RND transporter periplasmic adaptor subunit [Bermanella marisrubri]EAT12195.1 AcrA/AcrE family protein [Oceanobacter sp. RED65] [Bermanella marisrubri]QIZ83667.1 efflux RND transporter periplasmic adaptor subunit [Bermanella marisrubri]
MKTLPRIAVTLAAVLSSFTSIGQDYQVTLDNYRNWYSLEARIEAVNEATVSAQTSGRIQSIAFDVNDYVEQGTIIIELRNKQQKAAFEQAQAGLLQAQAANDDAKALLKRSEPLHEQGSISQGEFDSIKARAAAASAQVKAARAQLEQAKEQLSYTQIRAPYSGIVKTRHVEVGEAVNPGMPLMTGLSLAKLRAVADIPQRFSPHLSEQKDFKVAYQHNSEEALLDAEKVTVFPYADPNSHSFRVRVEVNSEGSHLFPGMWVKLKVPMGEKQSLRIPERALMQKGDLNSVYVKLDSGYILRQVRIGHRYGDQIEVLSGLRDGETISLKPYAVMANKEL